MPLVKFNPTQHSITHLKAREEVKQKKLKTRFFTEESQREVLLYSHGMNPCMGIVLHGQVEVKGEPDSRRFFAVFSHNEGLQTSHEEKINDEASKAKVIKTFCNTTVAEMILDVDDRYPLKQDDSTNEITLMGGYLIRVVQPEESTSHQNAVARELGELLGSPDRLKHLDDLKDMMASTPPSSSISSTSTATPSSSSGTIVPSPMLELVVAESYTLQRAEEPQVREDETDTMECCLIATPEGEVDVIYRHNLDNSPIFMQTAPSSTSSSTSISSSSYTMTPSSSSSTSTSQTQQQPPLTSSDRGSIQGSSQEPASVSQKITQMEKRKEVPTDLESSHDNEAQSSKRVKREEQEHSSVSSSSSPLPPPSTTALSSSSTLASSSTSSTPSSTSSDSSNPNPTTPSSSQPPKQSPH